MRATFGIMMGLAACWAGTVQAEEAEPRSARRAELILMGDTVRPRRAERVGVAAMVDTAPGMADEVPRDAPDAGLLGQMLSRLHAMAGVHGDFPDADIARPQESPIFVAPVSAISVPLWMRPGSAVAGETWRFIPGCASPGYRPTGFLRSEAELRRASYYGMMSRIACEYGIPVGLFDAMIIRESRYHPTIVSPKNAFGLTQLMPATAAGLGVDRYSVEGNLRGGASYLRQQLDRFGQYHLALAAYNAGPGRVRGGLVPRIRETQDYVVNVLADWGRLSGVHRQAVVFPSAGSVLREPTAPQVGRRTAAVSTF